MTYKINKRDAEKVLTYSRKYQLGPCHQEYLDAICQAAHMAYCDEKR